MSSHSLRFHIRERITLLTGKVKRCLLESSYGSAGLFSTQTLMSLKHDILFLSLSLFCLTKALSSIQTALATCCSSSSKHLMKEKKKKLFHIIH